MPESARAIENLILTYAACVDAGDFAGVGELFAEGVFAGSGTSATGREAVERYFRDTLIVYADGTPRTRHLTTNLRIDVDEAAGTATAHSYWTALQAVADLPLQPIATGHYDDRFARRNGQWRFIERRPSVDLAGNLAYHLKSAALS